MGWLIALGIVFLLAIFPLGVSAEYQQDGVFAWVVIGPVRVRFYPSKKSREEHTDEETSPEQEPQPIQLDDHEPAVQEEIPRQKASAPAEKSQTAETKRMVSSQSDDGERKGGSWKDFLPLVDVLRELLGDLRRKIRVRYLKVHVTLAQEDPCDLAINYGRMNVAVAGLLAQLHHWFVIQKQDVQLHCDFDAEETVVSARLDLTITVARALSLLMRYGLRLFRTYTGIQKQREGGANL